MTIAIPHLDPLVPGKAPGDTRVVVAMSGGVDSSVVAALLADLGYQVIGITLQLYDHGAMLGKKGACCAGADIHDARRVADRLAIPHYVLDYESRFREAVMEDFADTYLKGATPIPCVRCNQTVKFADLLAIARDLGADCMATGHYVQRIMGASGVAELHRGIDLTRDQSYFLFATTQQQLDFLRFPLGAMAKTQVRTLAEHYGLQVAAKPDSQDICFVPSGDYASVVKKLRPGATKPGEIVHVDGPVLGQHEGVIHYTVGQRKGLNIGGLADPLYVVGIDADKGQVIVGPRAALLAAQVRVQELNWLGAPLAEVGMPVQAKVRSLAPLSAGVLLPESGGQGEGQALLILDSPERGIAPGQACVFYAGTRVLGGGWIRAGISAYSTNLMQKLDERALSAV
jgi:tRNA-uridine 2-sulfurtransferase